MVRILILMGTFLMLGSRLAETLSSQCRCQNRSTKSRQFHNLSSTCELIPTQETQDKFNYIIGQLKIFILLNITFTASNCERQISNSHNDCNGTDDSLKEVIFPYQWTWVYKGENGMFPLMEYPYDYNIHSLWTLNRRMVNLDAVFVIPDNCTVTMGNAVLLQKVFWSLSKMSEKKMKPSWTGFLCYNIDNSKSLSSVSILIQRYIGFVRGITVKYCCPLPKKTSPDQMKLEETGGGQDSRLCSGNVVPTTMLMDLTTILGVMNSIFLPIILCFFLKEEPNFDSVPPDDVHVWINTEDGIFCFQHLIRWVFWWDHPSLTASRIRRILFIFLSPSIVYYHIIAEYYCMYDIQKEYLRRDIPLGVKSIPFGFWENYENTLGFFGGTATWSSMYFILISIIICLPKNVGGAIIGNLNFQTKSPSTFLILDAATLKKYSSVDISGHKNYRLAFETLKANVLMVLNYKFWIAIFVKWKDRINDVWKIHNECILIMFCYVVVNICVTIFYIFIFLVEVLACFCYYGFPIVFTFFSINVKIYEKIAHFWFYWMSRQFNQVPDLFWWVIFLFSISVTSIITLCTFFQMFYLCLCSFFILNLTLMFTLIGVIITPEIIGYVGYFMSAIFYINVIYKSFTTKYDTLLQSVAKTPSIYAVRNKNIQFIRQDMFYSIVEQIRPLRSELFLLLSKYFILFLYLSMSYNIIQQYQLSLQYTEKILSCLLITQIPKVVISILSQLTSNSYQNEFNEQKKVMKFLKKYKEKSNAEQL